MSLSSDFDSAIEGWLGYDSKAFPVTNTRAIWCCPEPALFRFARETRLDFDNETLKRLKNLAQPAPLVPTTTGGLNAPHLELAKTLFSDVKNVPSDVTSFGAASPPAIAATVHPLVEQAAFLVPGMARAVLAAHEVRHWKPDRNEADALPPDFVTHAAKALELYGSAWMLRSPKVTSSGAAPNRHGPPSTASWDVVRKLVANHRPRLGNGDHLSTLLLFRHLLGYLLNEPELVVRTASGLGKESETGPFRVDVSLLAAHSRDEGALDRGTVFAEPSEWDGFHLDAVMLGVRLLDDRFRQSLNIGWRCCLGVLSERRNLGKDTTPVAVRVGIRPSHPERISFSGGSAGSLLACGMMAAAERTPLTPAVSASIVLWLKDKTQENLDDPLTRHQIELVDVSGESLPGKLKAARQSREEIGQPKLDMILLRKGQTCRGASWDTWTQDLELTHGAPIRGVETLAEAYELLTGDALKDAMLESCCRQCARDWDPRLLKEPWPAPDHLPQPARPRPFVEPHYAELFAKMDVTDSTEDVARARALATELDCTTKYKPFLSDEDCNAVTRETARRFALKELARLMKVGQRICLAEDANSGKTIFSHRLRWFLASKPGRKVVFGGKPGLIVRFENRLGSQDWPKTSDELMRRLTEAVQKAARRDNRTVPDEQTAKAVVEYALNNHRIALVLDAVDQAGDPTELLKHLNFDPRWQQCPVVITGRSFAFRVENDSLFPRHIYKFVTIRPFDRNQQARLLAGVCAPRQDFRTLFESYDSVQELLAVPGMIAMVHGIAAEERKRSGRSVPLRLTQLVTRCDFYWQFYRKMMLRAARKHPEVQVDRHERPWQMMLAVTAFRMVLERATNYTVAGTVRDQVRADVVAYCRKFNSTELTADDWTRLQNFSALSDHDVLEGRDDGVLSWRHKGWMEFFYGLFLARYLKADCLAVFDYDLIRPDVPEDQVDQPGFQGLAAADLREPVSGQKRDDLLARELIGQLTNDPQWEWGWVFATDLPRIVCKADDRSPFHPQNLGESLAHLFRRPARGMRPTRLMYLALPYFECDHYRLRDFGWIGRDGSPLETAQALLTEWKRRRMKLPGADAVLAEFRLEFQEWRAPQKELGPAEWAWFGFTRSPHEIARELVADVSQPFPSDVDYQPKKHGFVLCPPKRGNFHDNPDAYPTVFLRGAPNGELNASPDEQPQHRVKLSPFLMQATTVTREQYRLFDPRLETAKIVSKSKIENYAPDNRHPAVRTSWWDAYLFARWLGAQYRLPTEAQWEYGCRAGTKDATAFGDSLESTQANFDGNDPYNGAKRGPRKGKTTEVGSYASNAWHVFDMHGNVMEWCWDWYDCQEYKRKADAGNDAEDPLGPSGQASYRVSRGGSWGSNGWGCRSARRNWRSPEFRDFYLGFRLVAVRGSE
jgi:formylglycine-generating enzyme required for sulfatase activity